MYKCDVCGKISQPREACSKTITGKREVSYFNTVFEKDKIRIIVPGKLDPENLGPHERIVETKETKGWEITGEKKVCVGCKEKQ